MTTKEQIEQNFKADFQALLDKYNATIEADDHFQGYAECGEDIQVCVYIPGSFDKDGEIIQETADFNLGRYLPPTKKV